MTNEELKINLTIAEAMLGKKIKICYEDWDEEKECPKYIPSGKPWRTHQIYSKSFPNFCKNWEPYGQAVEWLKKQGWFGDFIDWFIERNELQNVSLNNALIVVFDILTCLKCDATHGAWLIAEFIRTHPDLFKEPK